MPVVEVNIEVAVAPATAYGQWTRFEEQPRFLPSLEEIVQLDATHLRCRAACDGTTREWVVEITEQRPDERVAWHIDEANAGVVTFDRLDDHCTRVTVMAEVDGTSGPGVEAKLRAGLERFRELLESRRFNPGRTVHPVE